MQRLFGEDRLPDEVDVTRDGATSPADEWPAPADASAGDEPGFGRDEAPWTPFDAPAVLVDGDPRDYFTDEPPPGRGPIDLDEGPAPVTMLGVPALGLERWFETLQNPPKPEQVAAFAVLLISTVIGSRSPGGWVRCDELFAVMPRSTVDEGLRRLRYSAFLFFHPDGRFRVVGTPLTRIAQENAA